MVYLVFMLFLYIHVFSCFLWYVFKIQKEWIPPLNFIYGETDIWYKGSLYQYVFMLYYGVMAFGRNEIAPSTSFELLFVSFFMVASAMY